MTEFKFLPLVAKFLKKLKDKKMKSYTKFHRKTAIICFDLRTGVSCVKFLHLIFFDFTYYFNFSIYNFKIQEQFLLTF